MRPWLSALADLVVGACCPACDEPGWGLCASCARNLRPHPRDRGDGVVASASYADDFRTVTMAWKVDGRRGLDTFMAHHLAASVAMVAGERAAVSLVPIPSTWRSRRERGRDLVADTAASASRMLRTAGLHATTDRSLVLRRQTADQHLLSADERAANVRGALTVGVRARSPVVVVDDIVTTGSTLAAAELALRGQGIEVLGSAVIAATPERPLARTTATGLRST